MAGPWRVSWFGPDSASRIESGPNCFPETLDAPMSRAYGLPITPTRQTEEQNMTRVTMDKLEALAFDYRIPMERHGQTWRVILPGVRTYYAVIA